MTITKTITACIDGSTLSDSICDAACWLSIQLNLPLKLLHVIEKNIAATQDTLSGEIGLASRETLLNDLVEKDASEARQALLAGKQLLETYRSRAASNGITELETQQKHGFFMESLLIQDEDTELFVMGQMGKDHLQQKKAIGGHVENVARALATPLFLTTGPFVPPTSAMIAYDGSDTANSMIQGLSLNPLLRELAIHLVEVASDNDHNRQALIDAKQTLEQQGLSVTSELLQGRVVAELINYQQQHQLDVIIMGAYGHSRLREFFMGSNTSALIQSSAVPVLLFH